MFPKIAFSLAVLAAVAQAAPFAQPQEVEYVTVTLQQTQTAVAAAATQTSAAAAASTSTTSSSSAGKRGLCYNDSKLMSPFSSDKITWAYNWASKAWDGMANKDYEYVPMLWGAKDFTNWQANAQSAIDNGSTHLLSFNEPDLAEQASMSVADAVTNYKKYMVDMFGDKAKLGAPAVTNSGTSGQGLDWLSKFMTQCSDCQIDFVPIHWYDTQYIDLTYFKKHMADAKAAANGKKLWLTEFGLFNCDIATQKKFLDDVLPWLDEQDYIERYAYFGVFENNLVSSSKLTASGESYNS